MTFPTSLDSFPSSATLAGHNLDTDPHSTLHGNIGTAVAALETKVGIDSSADTTSVDYKIGHLGGDVSGTVVAATVSKVQGKAWSATAPTNAQLPLFDGTTWNPKSLSGDATVTNLGVVTLKNTGTAGTVGDSTHSLTVTTDAQGRVTAATANAISASGIGALVAANNLSDVTAATARTNLGLGGAAVLAVGTTTGTVAAGDDSRITGAAQKASNLSDLANAGTARTNLGLAAVASSGSATDLTAGTLPAGRFPALTGDITTVSGALGTTLATVNASPGTTGDSSHVTQTTTNAKGLVTSNTSVAISPSAIGALVAANNLSDVTAATAVSNLGLPPAGVEHLSLVSRGTR